MKRILVSMLVFCALITIYSGYSKNCFAGQKIIRFAYFPIANLTPLYVAIEKGYFRKSDVTIELKRMMGSPLIASTIAANKVDAGSMSFITQVLSGDKGIPMRLIASFGYCAPGKENQCMVVLKDSPIKSLADLKGKTIGGAMKATEPWFWTMDALKKVNVTKYRYIEMRTPEIPVALQAKTIDSAQLSEPNLTMMAEKIRIIHTFGNVTGACGYAFNTDFLNGNPEVIRSFIEALEEAVGFIEENETEARLIMAKYTGVPEDVALKVILPSWDRKSRILVDEAEKEIDWMLEYKMIHKRPSPDNLFDSRFTDKTTIADLVKEKQAAKR